VRNWKSERRKALNPERIAANWNESNEIGDLVRWRNDNREMCQGFQMAPAIVDQGKAVVRVAGAGFVAVGRLLKKPKAQQNDDEEE